MRCVDCGSEAVTERPERTAQGYKRFRCRTCGKQFNERSGTLLNRAQYPSDVIALVVLWRLRYKLALRDLPEMFLVRGIVFSHEAVREWEAKLTPAMAEDLRRRRRGKAGRSWYVDETYIKVRARSEPSWARRCGTGPAVTSTTGWNKITAASKTGTDPCVVSSVPDQRLGSAGLMMNSATSFAFALVPTNTFPPAAADCSSSGRL
jgi:DNA-directed RNA polymerase subunit RPC12/RpoP